MDFDESRDVYENDYQISTAPSMVSFSEPYNEFSDAAPAPVKRPLMRQMSNGGLSQQIISPNGDSSETGVNNSSVSLSDLFGAPAPPPSRRTMPPQNTSMVTPVNEESASSSDVNFAPVARTDSLNNRAAPPPPPQGMPFDTCYSLTHTICRFKTTCRFNEIQPISDQSSAVQ